VPETAAACDDPSKRSLRVGVLYRQIRSWAQKNNWYRTHIVSHKLWLKRNFGKEIRKKAVALEAAGAAALAARIEREFAELLDRAGVFDKLCKRGCASEDEFAEFERVKQQVRSEAFKLAQVLQTADKKPPSRARIPITDDQGGRGAKNRPKMPEPYITFAKAADLLAVSTGTVSRWAGLGKITDNGKRGQGRKLSKASVLMLKAKREQEDMVGYAADIQQDAARLDRLH